MEACRFVLDDEGKHHDDAAKRGKERRWVNFKIVKGKVNKPYTYR
jgi:hypothetical protein